MNIAVCFKIVPSDNAVSANPNRTLSISQSEIEVSSFDMYAIEAAMNTSALIEGSKVVAVTANNEVVENVKMRKAALSRGPAELISVKNDALGTADASATASVLANVIRKIDDCQLIICGEGSADMYNQQVGNMLGFILGYTTVNGVSKITPNGDSVIVERSVETGSEVMEIKLPAVLSVTTDINVPRIPSMKDILGAGKKPFSNMMLEELDMTVENKTETVSVLAPAATDRKKMIYDASDAAAMDEFLAAVAKVL